MFASIRLLGGKCVTLRYVGLRRRWTLGSMSISSKITHKRSNIRRVPVDNPHILLSFMCECGSIEIVKRLLDNDVNPSGGDNQPLMNAVKNGHNEIVRILVKNSNVNIYARDGAAFRIASDKNDMEMIRSLLSNC